MSSTQRLIAALTLSLAFAPVLLAAPDAEELRAQQERQRQIQGDTDQMAKAFEKYNPVKVIRHPLEDKTVENLKEALDATPAEG